MLVRLEIEDGFCQIDSSEEVHVAALKRFLIKRYDVSQTIKVRLGVSGDVFRLKPEAGQTKESVISSICETLQEADDIYNEHNKGQEDEL